MTLPHQGVIEGERENRERKGEKRGREGNGNEKTDEGRGKGREEERKDEKTELIQFIHFFLLLEENL